MPGTSTTWSPNWRLGPGQILDTPAALERLDYCLEWRAWLWRRPAIRLLAPFEQFRGKKVMDLGARYGRMSCLFAAAGAEVTGVDLHKQYVERAREEAGRWGIESRIRFELCDEDCANLPEGRFDVIFTRSTLVVTDKRWLDDLLAALARRLAPGGVGLFLENSTNRLFDMFRRLMWEGAIGRERWKIMSWGFNAEHLRRVERAFGSIETSRHLWMVWAIRARSRAG